MAASRPANRGRLERQRSAAVALSTRPRRRLRAPIAGRPGAARCRPVALEGALHRHRRADTAAGRLLAWLFRLPAATDGCTIAVEFAASGTVKLGRGASAAEHALAAVHRPAQAGGLDRRALRHPRFRSSGAGRRRASHALDARMRCCGLPLPRALWPTIEATETEEEGRFCFDVQIGLPLVGRLVRYRGWLTSP